MAGSDFRPQRRAAAKRCPGGEAPGRHVIGSEWPQFCPSRRLSRDLSLKPALQELAMIDQYLIGVCLNLVGGIVLFVVATRLWPRYSMAGDQAASHARRRRRYASRYLRLKPGSKLDTFV